MTTLMTREGARPATGGCRPSTALGWFAGFVALMFAVPALGTDALGLHHDLYYLIYATAVVGYLAAFLGRTGVDWRGFLRTNLWWSLGFGAAVAFGAVRSVMEDASTAHPGGAFYLFELGWRGVVYGTIDGVAMLAFPAFVAYLVMHGDRTGFARKAAFAGLTLVLVLGVTAMYHVGYEQFRGHEVKEPLTGALVMSVPTLLTGNPAGGVVAHVAVHTAAVTHEYYGSDPGFLPPKLTGYEDNGGGVVGWLLAMGWLTIVALFVTALARYRDRPPAA